ncbi:MAG: YdiU family protein [Pseudomonadales bacterium]
MSTQTPIPFSNSFARLPDAFYSIQNPTPVKQPGLIQVNEALAEVLGISAEWLRSEQGIASIAGNFVPEGAEPLAAAYAGHQFGGWNPQLGDGRAVLLGEVLGNDGQQYDIQLKGSGRTHWSRGGDGRSPLGPVLREYIVSEAMAKLGVATSRSLAAVTTGEQVHREESLPGAVLCRVAKSHVRIGSFQYFAARQDTDSLKTLCDFVIDRHYPAAAQASNPILEMLNSAIQRQAELVASWQGFGFIHGVMNTDNMLLSGETIDYGPCAFMDTYHPEKVFSSIDHQGRYAYQNQPGIAHWNLMQLAQCLLPLLDDDQESAVGLAQSAIDTFPAVFAEAYNARLNEKFGFTRSNEDDQAMTQQFFSLMAEHKLDFTLSFRCLYELLDEKESNSTIAKAAQLQGFPQEFDIWIANWKLRVASDGSNSDAAERMKYANPAVIARNHQVEHVIRKASNEGDFEPFYRLLAVLQSPWSLAGDDLSFAEAPATHEIVSQTFCGT